MLKNKDVDTMLKTLRKHSPDWIDRIRRYIKALEKDYVNKEGCHNEIRKLSKFETERIKQLKTENINLNLDKLAWKIATNNKIKQLKENIIGGVKARLRDEKIILQLKKEHDKEKELLFKKIEEIEKDWMKKYDDLVQLKKDNIPIKEVRDILKATKVCECIDNHICIICKQLLHSKK